MASSKDSAAARRRILDAGMRLFAKHGYRGTTVAMIASESGLNGALVNYYFGDKAKLYTESWAYAYERNVEKYPLYGDAGESAPAVKRLEGIIASDILGRSDPENYAQNIMLNELSAPTGLLDDVYEKAFVRYREALRGTVHEILGGKLPESEWQTAVLTIFSMCAVPIRQMQRMEGNPKYSYDPKLRAKCVFRFAMAGLVDLLGGGTCEKTI